MDALGANTTIAGILNFLRAKKKRVATDDDVFHFVANVTNERTGVCMSWTGYRWVRFASGRTDQMTGRGSRMETWQGRRDGSG